MDDLTSDSIAALAKLALQAAQGKDLLLGVAVLLIVAVLVLRRFLAPRVPFFASALGGSVLVFSTAFAGALLTSLLAGQGASPALFLSAAKVAFIASGGWSLVGKRVAALLQRGDAEKIKAEALAAGGAIEPPKPVGILELAKRKDKP